MDTNVGEMPIEIFGDYLTDTLEQEWSWEYLFLSCNGSGYGFGSSDIFSAYHRNQRLTTGFGDTFGYGREIYAYGSGGTASCRYGHGLQTYSGVMGAGFNRYDEVMGNG